MTVKELIQVEIDKLSEENLYALYEVVKQFAREKTQPKKGALSKLKSIKIQGPEDFAENIDVYLGSQK
jgi:hypothetical protein